MHIEDPYCYHHNHTHQCSNHIYHSYNDNIQNENEKIEYNRVNDIINSNNLDLKIYKEDGDRNGKFEDF